MLLVQQVWIEENLPVQMVQGVLVMLHKGAGKSKEDLLALDCMLLL